MPNTKKLDTSDFTHEEHAITDKTATKWITAIFSVILAVAGATWAYSSVNGKCDVVASQVADHEKRLDDHDNQIKIVNQSQRDDEKVLNTVAAKMDFVVDAVKRIETKVDRGNSVNH